MYFSYRRFAGKEKSILLLGIPYFIDPDLHDSTTVAGYFLYTFELCDDLRSTDIFRFVVFSGASRALILRSNRIAWSLEFTLCEVLFSVKIRVNMTALMCERSSCPRAFDA